MKNIKVAYQNISNSKKDYGGGTYLIRRYIFISLKGDMKTLSSIATAIDESLWKDKGFSLSIQYGGRNRRNELVIFLSQDLYAHRYERKVYGKAKLAVYGILASYGVKL